MTKSPENNFFTAADIERYHNGQMSNEERHALEKAALEDPFLADALEGYVYTANAREDLEKIKSRLEEKSQSKKTVVLWNRMWLKVAAVIIVVGTGIWLIFRTSSSGNDSLAVKTEKQQTVSGDTTAASQYAMPQQNEINTDQKDSAKFDLKEKKQSPESLSTSGNSDNNKQEAEIADEERTMTNEQATGNAVADNKHVLQYNNANNKEFKKEAPNFEGYAKSINNGNGNQFAQRTKTANNSFLKDSGRADKDYAFLEGKTAGVNRDDTIRNFNVVLTPQANVPLREVVVSDAKPNAALKKERMQGVVIDTLEPAEGWSNFDDYIAGNLKVPEELKAKPNTQSEVELSFDVNENGEPINITVEKSLCAKCDEEAIRLLKEGPKWKKKKNKKGKVKIRF